MVSILSSKAQRPAPKRHVVLLGASNATMGLSTIIETARITWGQPLDVMAAIGHGRSYGVSSCVLGRSLKGITSCGIWEDLANRIKLPTAALVTDIGNDIVYGSDVEPIVRWLETCVRRLAECTDQIVITRLPLESVTAIPAWKFRLFVSILFPGSRLKYAPAMGKAEELDQRVFELGNRLNAHLVDHDRVWYGWDPIHIAWRHRPAAWQKILTGWSQRHPPTQATRSLRRWLTLQRARPLQWRRFGFERHCGQPTVQLTDGSTLSLY